MVEQMAVLDQAEHFAQSLTMMPGVPASEAALEMLDPLAAPAAHSKTVDLEAHQSGVSFGSLERLPHERAWV